EFRAMKPSTQKERRYIIERFRSEHGPPTLPRDRPFPTACRSRQPLPVTLPPACAAETASIDRTTVSAVIVEIFIGYLHCPWFEFQRGERPGPARDYHSSRAGLEPAPTKPKFRRYRVTSQRAAALTIRRTDDMDGPDIR